MVKMKLSRAGIFLLCILVSLSQKDTYAQCTNGDFESGNFNGWTGTWSEAVCSGVRYVAE